MATKPTKDEPYLILMDNHTTRFNYEVLQWMYDHHMKLYAFPPYSTPILQPLEQCLWVKAFCLAKSISSRRVHPVPSQKKWLPQLPFDASLNIEIFQIKRQQDRC